MESGLQLSGASYSASAWAVKASVQRVAALQGNQGLAGKSDTTVDSFENTQPQTATKTQTKTEKAKPAPATSLFKHIQLALRPLLNVLRTWLGLPIEDSVLEKATQQAVIRHELAHALIAYLSGFKLEGLYLNGSEGFKRHAQAAEQTAFVRFTSNSAADAKQKAALFMAGLASGLQPATLALKPNLLASSPNASQEKELKETLLLGADTDMQQLLKLLKEEPALFSASARESSVLKQQGKALSKAIQTKSASPQHTEEKAEMLTTLLRQPTLQRLHQQVDKLLNSVPEASWQGMLSELEGIEEKQLEGKALTSLFKKHIGSSRLQQLRHSWQQQA